MLTRCQQDLEQGLEQGPEQGPALDQVLGQAEGLVPVWDLDRVEGRA